MLFNSNKNSPVNKANALKNAEVIEETSEFNKSVSKKMNAVIAEWRIIKNETKELCEKREKRLDDAQGVGSDVYEILNLTRELSSAEKLLGTVADKYTEAVSFKASLDQASQILDQAYETNMQALATTNLPGLDGNDDSNAN